MERAKHERGMTLIELIVVLAIAGILMGMAVPSYVVWRRTEQVRSGARDLALALHRAKSFAVRRGNNVIVAFNSPAAGSYQVVNDADDDCVVDVGEAVLYQAGLPPNVTIPVVDNSFSSENAAFDPRGLPLGDAGGACVPFGTGGGAGSGTILVQMAGHNAQYLVSMNLAGGITVARQ